MALARVAAMRALVGAGVGVTAAPSRKPHLLLSHLRRRQREVEAQRVTVRGVTISRAARRPSPPRVSPPPRPFAAFSSISSHDSAWSPRATSDECIDSRCSGATARARSFPCSASSVPAESLTVTQLRAVLRARGERVGGKKRDLARRVVEGGTVTGEEISAFALETTPLATRRHKKKDVDESVRGDAFRKKKPPPKPPLVLRWSVPDPPPRAGALPDDVPALRVVSWNVNGIRALLEKDPDVLDRVASEESADVLVLQETKIQEKHVGEIDARVLAGYPHRVWNCSTARLGYSGTALFSRRAPTRTWTDPACVSAPGFGDFERAPFANEGRVVVAEFQAFFVVGAYAPNSGAELARLGDRTRVWDRGMASYLRTLEKKKPVVYCGDLNVAARDIDVWGNRAANRKRAGFTDEEREAFARYYTDTGSEGNPTFPLKVDANPESLPFVDTFRKMHPGASAYSWWSYRGGARNKNRGWRIDYVLASDTPKLTVHDAYIRGDVGGSDHCPVGAVLRLEE